MNNLPSSTYFVIATLLKYHHTLRISVILLIMLLLFMWLSTEGPGIIHAIHTTHFTVLETSQSLQSDPGGGGPW